MALTDNSTAKLGRTKSSPSIPWQASEFQRHLYGNVRISIGGSLIPPYVTNSTKRKIKNKTYFTIYKDLSSFSFIVNKLLSLFCHFIDAHHHNFIALMNWLSYELLFLNKIWGDGLGVFYWFGFILLFQFQCASQCLSNRSKKNEVFREPFQRLH